jgi:uncharacterized protein (UPF0335 family)
MAFWERVKEELRKAAQEGWGAVKEGAKIAAEKSEEMAKVGKLRYRTHNLNKQAEKLFADLGGQVYDMAKPPYENPLSNAEVMKLVEDIKKLEEDKTKVEAEIEEVRKKAPAELPKE